MSNIQFIGTTPTELITELKKSLIPELKEQLSKEFQPKQTPAYLTRSEVCQLLKINLSTLYRWTKEGLLPSFSLGNRIYFKLTDIEEIINKNKLS